MMVNLIFIYKKNLFKFKIEIYHVFIKVITKNKCNNKYLSDKFPDLHFENWLNIMTLDSKVVETLLIICTNRNIEQCHPIFISMNINYKR